MEITQLGKGCLPQPVDERDFQFSFGAVPVEWTKEFRLPEPPNENQGSSLSCVGQATSYYHWQLNPKNFSRRDLYADIALPQGGAYLRDGVRRVVTKGQATRDEVPDPSPQTEVGMRDKTGLKDEYRTSDMAANYFVVPTNSIDAVAQTIRDFKGCLYGLNGDNKGWADLTNPKPPTKVEWGHAIYGFGYHMHDGMKCIISKSSWCQGSHHEHHIKENYFNSGNVFNAWTLIPKEQQVMTNAKLVKDQTPEPDEYGLYLPATSEDGLITLMRNVGLPVPLLPNGKLDWSKVQARHSIIETQ